MRAEVSRGRVVVGKGCRVAEMKWARGGVGQGAGGAGGGVGRGVEGRGQGRRYLSHQRLLLKLLRCMGGR